MESPSAHPFADRKKVLKHHPDKKAGLAGDSNDDAFFKCIQKAFEVLTNPERRRQFDSVDPYYELLEADVPAEKQLKSAKDTQKFFFQAFAPVFEREARFSRKQPVPMLGIYGDSKETVEAFYDFWYNFDSWRSFEYLDKEVNEGSDKCVPPTVVDCMPSFTTAFRAAGMTNGILRRRTSPSARGARRRIPPVCVVLLTLRFPSTRASSVSSRRRRDRKSVV